MSDDGGELEDELMQWLQKKYPGEDDTFGPAGYLYARGGVVDALLYRDLFWPTFVEVEGMVFWKVTLFDAEAVGRVHTALRRYGYDKIETEKSFNFIEIPELFQNDPDDVSRELMDDLTRSLCETWKARLESTFPEKRFVVDFVPADDQTGKECGLLFYQA